MWKVEWVFDFGYGPQYANVKMFPGTEDGYKDATMHLSDILSSAAVLGISDVLISSNVNWEDH